MPLPTFPELPDDDPIEALRISWRYLKNLGTYLLPLRLLVVGLIVSIIIFVLARTYGYKANQLISWAADCVPLFFTFISIVLTLHDLKKEQQTLVIILLALAGLAGTVMLHLDRTNQQSDMRHRLDAVTQIASKLLDAELKRGETESQTKQTDSERRENIVTALRSQYIASHDNLSPRVLSGTDYPPDLIKWINEQLATHGEKWQLSVSNSDQARPTIVQTPPDIKEPQPIEVEMYCNDMSELPVTIPAHGTIYLVNLNKENTISNKWLISKPIRAGAYAVQWPDSTTLKSMPSDQRAVSRCDVTNHGMIDLLNVKMLLSYNFQEHGNNTPFGPLFTNPIFIAPLLRNETASLFIVDDCPIGAAFQRPAIGSATPANENKSRDFSFITPDGAGTMTIGVLTPSARHALSMKGCGSG